MRALSSEFPLRKLCQLLQVPRSSAYYTSQGPLPVDLTPLKELIRTVRVTFPGCGFRKMHRYLVRHYTSYPRSQVQRAYVELGILGKAQVRKVRTTNSESTERRFANRIKDLAIVRPNQVWVGDVTYIRVRTAGAFLALLMDAFSRMILGWGLSLVNDTMLAKEALEMALKTGSPEIHHTDQGSPYGSAVYTKRLQSLGIQSSMSKPGKPEDNGRAERLNRTIKEEEVYRNEYQTVAQARHAIEHFIQIYNHQRLHQALNYRTPNEVHRLQGGTP